MRRCAPGDGVAGADGRVPVRCARWREIGTDMGIGQVAAALVEGLEGRTLLSSMPSPNIAVTSVDYRGTTSVMAGLTTPVLALVTTHNVRGAVYPVAYYLSKDEQFSASKDRLIQTAKFGNNGGGAQRDVRIPADVKAGTYFIIVVADPKNQIGESDENDNVLSGPALTVTGAEADLSVGVKYQGVKRLVGGAIIRPAVTLKNVGTAAAKGTAGVSFYLVDSLQSDVSGLTPLNPAPIPVDVNLAAGASMSSRLPFDLPGGVDATNKLLEASVALPGVSEISTANNAAVAPGTTLSLGGGLVDLAAAFAGKAPATLSGGKKNSVKVKVTNVGNATVKATFAVQPGLERPVGGAVTFFGGSSAKRELKPGQSTTVTLSLPAGQSAGEALLAARVVYSGDQDPGNDVVFSAAPVTFT